MSYLDEITDGVQTRPIPWDGYLRGNNITKDQATALKPVDKPGPARQNAVKADPEQYASAITSILNECHQDEVVKFALLFAADTLNAGSFSTALAKSPATWQLLAGLAGHQDQGIRLLSTSLLTQLAQKEVMPVDVAPKAFDALYADLTSENPSVQDLAVQWTALLLQGKQYRGVFWEHSGKFLPVLVKTIDASSGSSLQSQYYSLLVLWLLSFDKAVATPLVTDYETVEVVLNAAKSAVKDKITRVAVATLLNLVTFAPSASAVLIAHRGLPIVNALSERKWSDDELREDVQQLKSVLTDAFETMSTFDVYLTELNSKHLQWSPPHRSTSFWKANIAEFAANDYKVLRKLVKLLLETSTPLVQAVACNDIAFIVNEDPEATQVLADEQGVKQHIMALMDASDPEVRYEALRATQAFISKLFKA